MNISEFLKLPFTQEFKMLAGKNGAKNAITGVNILDNPRASEWLSPGELILTSGYLFSETPDALEKVYH
jgi:Purine catabolism regulatory protein-like family.